MASLLGEPISMIRSLHLGIALSLVVLPAFGWAQETKPPPGDRPAAEKPDINLPAKLAAGDASRADDPNVPQTIELTLSPAAEPRPALKYRLMPAASERTPGNAAPFYYRAILHLNNLPKDYWKPYDENQETWLSS